MILSVLEKVEGYLKKWQMLLDFENCLIILKIRNTS